MRCFIRLQISDVCCSGISIPSIINLFAFSSKNILDKRVFILYSFFKSIIVGSIYGKIFEESSSITDRPTV